MLLLEFYFQCQKVTDFNFVISFQCTLTETILFDVLQKVENLSAETTLGADGIDAITRLLQKSVDINNIDIDQRVHICLSTSGG